jgi:hypothetical protein
VIPDRTIVKKLKRHYKGLYVRWNAESCWFEVWSKEPFKAPYMITPVTQSIYDTDLPVSFAPLDERIVWWISQVDFASKLKKPKEYVKEWDSRWQEAEKLKDIARRSDWRARAAEMWNLANNHFVSSTKRKNDKPKFNNYKTDDSFVRPDVQHNFSSRIMYRSRNNALKYNYRKG